MLAAHVQTEGCEGSKQRKKDVDIKEVEGCSSCGSKPWDSRDPRQQPESLFLVSRYSAIGDTISCDAPYSAIGFREALSAIPSFQGLSLDCDRPFVWKEVGV